MFTGEFSSMHEQIDQNSNLLKFGKSIIPSRSFKIMVCKDVNSIVFALHNCNLQNPNVVQFGSFTNLNKQFCRVIPGSKRLLKRGMQYDF